MPNQPSDARPAQLLPENVRLLHIGFHKTGTTSLQTAFASAREVARLNGVSYPGNGLQHSPAALGVMNRTFGWPAKGGTPPRNSRWEKLVKEVNGTSDRVFMSSEFLEEADTATIQRIAQDLGPDLHVVATLRSLGRMLPSIWQQHVKNGLVDEYEQWLKANLDNRNEKAKFWIRHDHPRVISRWASVVGPENFTAVVVDESDRNMIFDTFETMLGLPAGLLGAQPTTFNNRSMTAAEAELLRRVNKSVRERGMRWPEYQALVRKGAALNLVESRRPGRDEQMIGTPDWALDRAAELGTSYAASIQDLGVNVVGDLSSLGRRAESRGTVGETPTEVPLEAALEAVLGVVGGALRDLGLDQESKDKSKNKDKRSKDKDAPEVAPVISTRDLVKLTGRRVARSSVNRVRSIGRR
jgi:hypothetical protein